MPKSGVYRKRLAHKQAGKRGKRMADCHETRKCRELGVKGKSTMKSGRFLE